MTEMPEELNVRLYRNGILSARASDHPWHPSDAEVGVARYLRADLVAAQDARIQALEAALRKLRNEVGGLSAFEHDVRTVIGNTNWSVLSQRVAEADDALGDQP